MLPASKPKISRTKVRDARTRPAAHLDLGAGHAHAFIPNKAHRQSQAVAVSAQAREDKAFIESVPTGPMNEARPYLDRIRREGLCLQATPGRDRAGR